MMARRVDAGQPAAPRLLFIGPLPEPVTGHSLACKVLLDALEPTHDVHVVNLSKASFGGGITSARRIGEVLAILAEVWRGRRADAVYFTISESIAGNLKDLLIYALCWPRLARMAIHLHGGSIRKHIFDRHPVLRALNRIFLRRLGAVIVLGRTHLEVFNGLVPADRLYVVPNFAEDHLFADEASIRSRFASTEVLDLLFLGNLIEGKGHGDLLAGYQRLPDQYRRRVRLHFAGAVESAALESAFRATIGTDAMVTYHGVVGGAEKRRLLHQAHALVLPTSLSEGQPISILEAYAAGCIVLTTACGGIPDIFTPGEQGFAIRPHDPDSIRDAIIRAIGVGPGLADIGLANWRTATRAYRTSAHCARLVALIDAL